MKEGGAGRQLKFFILQNPSGHIPATVCCTYNVNLIDHPIMPGQKIKLLRNCFLVP